MAAGSYVRKEIVGGAPQTTLTAGISDVATTISIASATGWPDGASYPFVVAIDLGQATEEKVLCLSRTGTTITVTTRGYDDTTGVAHSLGATIDHVLDASTVDQANRLANQLTTKGDIFASNGTNPVRRGVSGTDGFVLQELASEADGLTFARLVTILSQASAPNVAGYVRLWFDETTDLIRASDGSSWLIPANMPVVADGTARDTLLGGSPANGSACWRTDLLCVERRVAGAWRADGTPRFTNSTARDAYFTAPYDGARAYLTGDSSEWLYRSNEWIRASVKITQSATQPTSPQTGDLWLQPVE